MARMVVTVMIMVVVRFDGFEGGFSFDCGSGFDGLRGTQRYAFQNACASVPARICLTASSTRRESLLETERHVRSTRSAGKGRSSLWYEGWLRRSNRVD